MVRKFVTYDGEVLAEEEWTLSPVDRCFFCDDYLILSQGRTTCPVSFSGQHDFVALVNPAA